MVTKYVVRGFSVLAIMVFGLFSGVASAAPGGSALPGLSGRVCSYIDVSQLPHMTGPNKCENDSSSANASAALTGQEKAAQWAKTASAASASLSAPAVVATNSSALTAEEKAALWLAAGTTAASASLTAPAVVATNSAALTGQEKAALWLATASAAPVTSSDSPACGVMSFNVDALNFNQMTGTYVPGAYGSSCSTADASQIIPLTGTFLLTSAFRTPQTSDYQPVGRSFQTPQMSDY